MDAAFKTGAYPAYTTAELIKWMEDGTAQNPAKVLMELQRRERRDAGDISVMSDGERLRFFEKGAK